MHLNATGLRAHAVGTLVSLRFTAGLILCALVLVLAGCNLESAHDPNYGTYYDGSVYIRPDGTVFVP
jgi:hypothetical protein